MKKRARIKMSVKTVYPSGQATAVDSDEPVGHQNPAEQLPVGNVNPVVAQYVPASHETGEPDRENGQYCPAEHGIAAPVVLPAGQK